MDEGLVNCLAVISRRRRFVVGKQCSDSPRFAANEAQRFRKLNRPRGNSEAWKLIVTAKFFSRDAGSCSSFVSQLVPESESRVTRSSVRSLVRFVRSTSATNTHVKEKEKRKKIKRNIVANTDGTEYRWSMGLSNPAYLFLSRSYMAAALLRAT